MLVALDVKVVSTGKVRSRSKLECKLGVVKRLEDIGDDSGFVDADTQDLSTLVDADDTVCGFVVGGHKDSLARDTIHVDTCATFQIVEMDEAVFGH